MSSIRRRLLVWLLAGLTVAVAGGAASVYRIARDQANALFDYQLQQTALSLRDQALASGLLAPAGEPDGALEVLVQIWNLEGARLYLSHPRSVMPAFAQLGFADVATPEGALRVFSARTRHHVVQVAQPQSVRDRLAAEVALRTVWPLLLALPLLGLLIWITVGRGLAPLERLAGEVRGRSPDALEPLPARALPGELRPLVGALNDLLSRLAQALAAQRALVADAAHELRTPLTALRLQARAAVRAPDAAARGEALAQLASGIERSSRLVTQLLALAREEGAEAVQALAPVRLDHLARELTGEQAAIAHARGVDLGVTRAEPVAVRASPDALRALTTNLIDNAIKYTPAGGRIDVAVWPDAGDAVLSVSDSGPGIPQAERARVFDRFYRVPGSAGEGSGLGLAIVQRVAARLGGTVMLEAAAPEGGLRVRVRLPRAGPDV